MKRLDNSYHDDKLNIFIRDTKKDCGFDDGTLLADMDAAEQAWKQEQLEHPEEAARIMQESDAKFEELMRRIEVEGIQPASTGHEAWEDAEFESDVEWDAFDEDEFDEAEDDDEEEEDIVTPMEAEMVAKTENVKTVKEEAADADAPKAEKICEDAKASEVAADEPYETVAAKHENRKVVSLKKRKKILLLVAAVAVLGAGTTFVAQGKREYKLRQYPVEAEKNIIVNHNSVYKLTNSGKLEDAYREIEEKLEINALKLGDIPEKMKFKQLLIYGKRAVIEFEYNKKSVYLEETKFSDHQEVSSVTISDRKDSELIYNEWLDKHIVMNSNILQNGEIEYSAGLALGDSYYYLSGVMDKEDFVILVEGANNK
ncbi:MAG: hypothetical protein MR868_09030 [Lachnospiraceae bacterium]|nr:hypothetical protein [Lachnospiraceae bacterium]